MSRRTTIILDKEVYERLAAESVRRYGTTRAMSRLVNDLLRKAFSQESRVIELLHREKVARTSAKEFEEFRRQFSKRLESS